MKIYEMFILMLLLSFNLNSSVTHIWPSSGINDTTRTVHIFGGGFNEGIHEVKLSREGSPEIFGYNINVCNDHCLTCEFALYNCPVGTYNLIINRYIYMDTLKMCFTVNKHYEYIDLFWDSIIVISNISWIKGVEIGDGNNDGELEIYGACNDDHIYQFKWNGSTWDKTDLGFPGSQMSGVAVGDGNNDGDFEVYGASMNGHIYQFKWNGSTWDNTDLGFGGNSMHGVAVGDGNNDGLLEVYGACHDFHIYQFKWNGSSWGKTDLGSGGEKFFTLAVGDGNNDGELEIYGACYDEHIYQFKWNGATWDKTDISSGGGFVLVGDGNNDGEIEIYSTYNNNIYQFKWNGATWVKTDLGSLGYQTAAVAVGDGNNDGEIEVYGTYRYSIYEYPIYQFKWNGNSWIKTYIGSSVGYRNYINDAIVGDGNNDGGIEVFIGSQANIYQFQLKPNYLSDLLHEYRIVVPEDSAIWGLYIRNVAYQDLIVDSMVLPLSEYSIINYYLPDTIISGDSSGIDIMFKPESIGLFICSLEIFLNDSLYPVSYVCLEGIYDNANPAKVDLIFPDSAGYSNYSVEFCWHPSYDSFPGIDNYKFQHALDSNFTISLNEHYTSDTFFFKYLTEPSYYWRVKPFDNFGFEGPWSNIWSFTVDHLGIEENNNITNGFRFSFASISREKTVFRFSLPELSNISFKIYDIAGREVSEPISGQYQAGSYEIPFNPERSGVYFYQLESKFLNKTGKFTVLR